MVGLILRGDFVDWATQPLLNRQCSTNNNSNCDTSNNHTSKWVNHVYLGGSCSTQLTWREQIAIPLLKKHGLTYYNPAIRETSCLNNLINESNLSSLTNGSTYLNNDGNEEGNNEIIAENCILQWKKCIDKSKVLLFVITNDTRSLTSMILAAHYIGLDKGNVILCIQQLPTDDCQLGNEKVRNCFVFISFKRRGLPKQINVLGVL